MDVHANMEDLLRSWGLPAVNVVAFSGMNSVVYLWYLILLPVFGPALVRFRTLFVAF